MKHPLDELNAFVCVARAGGFREGAKSSGASPSGLSDAVRRLEGRLGVRLLNRTTRSVAPTEAGRELLERLAPALAELDAALDVVNSFRDRPAGTLRLNVPISAVHLVLPNIVAPFLAAYPDIRLEIIAEEGFVDVLSAGFDAGIRYEERLERDMIAVPIGPRTQRFAAAASPGYLDRRGRPRHPRELLAHSCLLGRFNSGSMPPWEFEHAGETIRVEPSGPLLVSIGTATELALQAARAGLGILYLFEDWLRPDFERGVLEPVLESWWPSFSGPYLYYSGRRLVPAALRAFIEFVREPPSHVTRGEAGHRASR